jgi:TonB family protein
MPETILVIEYEPRYTDRVLQALSGQPFTPSFARDGDEALRAIASEKPRLVVLSSVVPKASTADLIRAIRSQPTLQQTPILLTVSGYSGTTPQADARRVGASDILPKPYSDIEFLGKVQQLLGIAVSRPTLRPSSDHMVRATAPAEPGQVTSDDLFSDVLNEERTVVTPRKVSRATGNVDQMIADTLAGVRPSRRTSPGTSKPATLAGGIPTPKKSDETGAAALDKIVHDTLSGLEKTPARPKSTPPPISSPAVAPSTPPPPTPAATPSARAPEAPAQTPRPAAPTASATGTPARAPVVESAAADGSFDNVVLSQPIVAASAQPVEEEEPVDGIKFGQYVLLEKIATGGMAEVWKARMRGVEGFQKTVAIKKILPHLSDNQDFIEMFIDEAKLAAQLSHNNIIHIYDLGKIQNSYYIAMEYVDGSDLKTILKKAQDHGQPMTVDLALFVASKIASALDYAHRRRDFDDKDLGLVHRDVSPQNVLISQEGDIKLCDFGIAKAAFKASHTQNGALKGKLQYMSPEQAWGQPIDRRADVFALATVLFEMLTGKKLFTGDSEISILEQVREARVTPPSEWNDEVTPDIDAVVLKALQKDPTTRYQTAGEMARDMDQILYGMKPTPTSADLAILMHRISAPEPVMPKEPDLEETVVAPPNKPPEVAPVIAPVAAAPADAAASPAVVWSRAPFQQALEPKKNSPVLPIAIAAVLAIAVVVGVFFVMRTRNGSSPASTARNAGAAAPVSAAPAGAAATVPLTTSAATTQTAAVATATSGTVDPAKVEEEVRKRLDAERQKLDQLSRAQQPRPAATQTRPAVAAAAAPRPVVQSAPPPAASPVAAPVQTATTATQVAESRPAAAPAPEPAPRAREGDLVTTAEGLTPPRAIAKSAPQYPPLAQAQHIQGTVVISVLVSETGKVLDARVISGLARGGFGINDAAQQTVRRWTFAPGMKDGVHVKAWTTVRIDFKL